MCIKRMVKRAKVVPDSVLMANVLHWIVNAQLYGAKIPKHQNRFVTSNLMHKAPFEAIVVWTPTAIILNAAKSKFFLYV